MTLTLFITLVTILSLVSSLLTQAIKKTVEVKRPTLIVAIIAAIAGWGGGAAAYVLMKIPFDLSSIICLFLLAPTCWLTATLGYDKVMEVIKQIGLMKIIDNID